MSTKIYEAYRLPKNKLNEFLLSVREDVLSNAAAGIKTWTNNLQSDYVAEKFQEAKEQNSYLEPEDNFRYRFFLCVEPMLENSSKSPYRSYFNIDSSFNIWINGRYAYIIPYTSFKFDTPDYLEDYSYWNNVDMPEGISSRQWATRGKKWEEVCLIRS